MRITNILSFVFVLIVQAINAQSIPQLKIFPIYKDNCINSPIIFSSRIIESTPDISEPSTNSSYSWTVAPTKDLSNISATDNPSISLSFSAASTFTLFLIVKRGIYTIPMSTVVSISNYPKAVFNASLQNVGFPNQLILTSFSTNSFVNNWMYSDIPKVDSTANTIRSYTAAGAYSVMLVTYSKLGCSDTARYSFYLEDSSSITLPNIFTPNGDGNNDTYKPISKGISYLSAKIYNRNAVLVHFWEGAGGFWDGHTNSGEPCTDGEYFIILNAVGFEGKTYKLSSHITLVR